MGSFNDVIGRLRQGKLQRVLAFGSSNTARRLIGMHWFDCLDLAVHSTLDRHHRFINAGIGGNTSQQLLDRFEEDAALYKPHAVFITVGGNDALPTRQVTPEQFRANLLELHRRFIHLDCIVIFQTYYAPNTFIPGDELYLKQFSHCMEIVREVAGQTSSELIDHLARWEPFRESHPDHYRQLMQDRMHVNPQGNLVIGLDLAKRYGLSLGMDDDPSWAFPRQCQAMMDALEQRRGR